MRRSKKPTSKSAIDCESLSEVLRKGFEKPDTGKPEFMWTTKAGDRIPLSKIPDGHLLNISRYTQRKMAENENAIDFMYSPFAPGEDTMAADDGWRFTFEATEQNLALGAALRVINTEIKRRKLTVPQVEKERVWQEMTKQIKSIEPGPNGIGTIIELGKKGI